MEIIKINTAYIKLDQLLKWTGIAESGAYAKFLITEGVVKVNDDIVLQRGKKIFPGDKVSITLEENVEYVIE